MPFALYPLLRCRLTALLLLFFTVIPLAAQNPGACPGGRISSVVVGNRSVFDLSNPDLDHRLRWAYSLANRLHVTTREEVIRREILVQEGDCYKPELVAESERVLRAAGLFADVDVTSRRQPDGSWRVLVDTRDDWSTRVEAQMGSADRGWVREFALRDNNALGWGRDVAAYYRRRWDKSVYGFSYTTPQLLETRWDGSFSVAKTATGFLFSESLAYPFVGDRGRWALRQQAQHFDHFFEFVAPSDSGMIGVLQPERRRTFDLGGVYRMGRSRNLTLFGAALAGEWIAYPSGPRLANRDENSVWADSLLPVPAQLDSISSLRLMLLAGQRQIRFRRAHALNTLNGTEDMRLGVEAELGIGRTLPAWSSRPDLAVEVGLFAARELGRGWLGGSRLLLEGKRDLTEGADREWSDVFGQLDGWAYWKPSLDARSTYVVGVSGAGGWNTTVPFQLTLGGNSGLRGYPRYVAPGGQRAVASLEQRLYWGWPLPQLFDLGSVLALDMGKSWAGDVPFGVDSPVLANVAVGLRAALPPGSPNTFRLDVGLPLRGDVSARDLVLTIGIGQWIGSEAVETSPELRRSSRRGISTSLFSYPN